MCDCLMGRGFVLCEWYSDGLSRLSGIYFVMEKALDAALSGNGRASHMAIVGLFLLMTILLQTFFTLVCSHLVAFSFLSAWHGTILMLMC